MSSDGDFAFSFYYVALQSSLSDSDGVSTNPYRQSFLMYVFFLKELGLHSPLHPVPPTLYYPIRPWKSTGRPVFGVSWPLGAAAARTGALNGSAERIWVTRDNGTMEESAV